MEQLAKDLKEIKRNNQVFIAIQGHSTDNEEFDSWCEANTPDGLIPSSWVDSDGIRRIYVTQPIMADYQRLELIDGKWVLKTDVPF